MCKTVYFIENRGKFTSVNVSMMTSQAIRQNIFYLQFASNILSYEKGVLNKNLSLYKNGLNEMLRPSNYRLVAEIQFSLSIPIRGTSTKMKRQRLISVCVKIR